MRRIEREPYDYMCVSLSVGSKTIEDVDKIGPRRGVMEESIRQFFERHKDDIKEHQDMTITTVTINKELVKDMEPYLGTICKSRSELVRIALMEYLKDESITFEQKKEACKYEFRRKGPKGREPLGNAYYSEVLANDG